MVKYDLLNKEDVVDLPNKTEVQGIAIIQSYSSATTKNGGSYFNGVLKAQGALDFKVWGGSLYDKLEAEDYKGVPVFITGEVNVWNGSISLILTSVVAVDPNEIGVDVTLLDPTNYDLDANEKEFYKLMKTELSEDAFELFKLIYNKIRPQFRQEYAAVTIHDASRGGLLAHTLKMLRLLKTTWGNYPNMREHVNKDIVFLGMAIHDMGKILEYNNGTRTDIAFATHNFLGQEILFEFKKDIVEGFEITTKPANDIKFIEPLGVDFYYRLQAVIQQHHGEFGEPCHTVESYIVHMVDLFESRMQMLEEKLPFTGSLSVEFGKYKVE